MRCCKRLCGQNRGPHTCWCSFWFPFKYLKADQTEGYKKGTTHPNPQNMFTMCPKPEIRHPQTTWDPRSFQPPDRSWSHFSAPLTSSAWLGALIETPALAGHGMQRVASISGGTWIRFLQKGPSRLVFFSGVSHRRLLTDLANGARRGAPPTANSHRRARTLFDPGWGRHLASRCLKGISHPMRCSKARGSCNQSLDWYGSRLPAPSWALWHARVLLGKSMALENATRSTRNRHLFPNKHPRTPTRAIYTSTQNQRAHLAVAQEQVPKRACPGKRNHGLQPAVRVLLVNLFDPYGCGSNIGTQNGTLTSHAHTQPMDPPTCRPLARSVPGEAQEEPLHLAHRLGVQLGHRVALGVRHHELVRVKILGPGEATGGVPRQKWICCMGERSGHLFFGEKGKPESHKKLPRGNCLTCPDLETKGEHLLEP